MFSKNEGLTLSVAAAMTGNFFKNKVDKELMEYGN